MDISINVGKNVATINGHQFPIDSDLTLEKAFGTERAWKTESIGKCFHFNPVVGDEISTETFVTYGQALEESVAFNRRGKMRRLFEHKEEGVKIIPGHGVFLLPSKMTVIKSSPRKIKIRVFSGTHLAQEFINKDPKQMVHEAANHYYRNLREFTDTVNASLWYPVKYRRKQALVVRGFELPDGVRVYTNTDGRTIGVHYTSIEEGRSMFLGTATTDLELGKMLNTADRIRQKEQQRAAAYRYIAPSFIQLSQYMRRV